MPTGSDSRLQVSENDFESLLSTPLDQPNKQQQQQQQPWAMRPASICPHDHASDRPENVFEGETTVFAGAQSCVLSVASGY